MQKITPFLWYAKEAEEAQLYRDMRNDAVQQLVRRLQAAQLKS